MNDIQNIHKEKINLHLNLKEKVENIRQVFYLTVIYKDEKDKNKWVEDEKATEIVRRIFNLTM